MFNTTLTTFNSSITPASPSNVTGCLALSQLLPQPLQAIKLTKHYQAKDYLKFQKEHHIDKECRIRAAADILSTLEANGFIVKKFINGQLVEIEATFPSALPANEHPSFWQKIINAFLRLTSLDTKKFHSETDLLHAIDKKYIEYQLQNTFLEEQEKLRTDSAHLPTNCTTLHAEVKNITMIANSGYTVNAKNYFIAYECGVDEHYLSNLVWNIIFTNQIKFILHNTGDITAFTQKDVMDNAVQLEYDPPYVPMPNKNGDDATYFLFSVKDIVTGNTTEPQRVTISFEMGSIAYVLIGCGILALAGVALGCLGGVTYCICGCINLCKKPHENKQNYSHAYVEEGGLFQAGRWESMPPLLPPPPYNYKPTPHKALATQQPTTAVLPIASNTAPILGSHSLFHHVQPKAQNKSINANYVTMHT